MSYTENKKIIGLEAKATPIDADVIVVGDTADTDRAKKTTFTQLKAFLKTYLDTLYQPVATVLTNTTASFTTALKDKLDGIATGANNYTHPNHTGDVTSAGDGATTIANGAVTLAKQANMATASVVYRKTAGDGAPEVQTLATLKTDLGLTGTNSGDQDLTGLVEKATLTTKGDVYVATASATPARLGVGTNGQVLTADSAEATGVKWSSPSGGVVDGDKGDITVSSSGSVWTIDNGVVTSAKTDAGVQASLGKADTALQSADIANFETTTQLNTRDTNNRNTDNHTDGTTNKVFSATEKTKLGNIAENANNYTHPNHSGDVTSVADGATTIVNSAVTNAKMANMEASTIKGRITTTGAPQDLTASEVRTMINVADGATANAGTVTSVGVSVPTGLTVSGTPVTSSGTIALGLDTDRVIPTQATLDAKVGFKLTTTASSATPTPTGDAQRNELIVTALDENATIAAPSGTAVAGNMLKIIITASGGTRTVGYNAALTAGNITRTTSVPTGKTLVQVYQYQNSTWKCHYDDLEA